MNGPQPKGPAGVASLGRWIAIVLRTGTLLAVAAIAAGFLLGLLAGGAAPGSRPVLDLIGSGDADALSAAGLLGLTLLPMGVLGVAAVSFGASGERRYLVASLATLVLLAGSLVVAALVAPRLG